MKLSPSEYLSQNEIDAATLVSPDIVNVQQQRRIDWPAKPVVARAYLDQLGRSGAIPSERADALTVALDRADQILTSETKDGGGVSEQLDAFATELERDSAGTSGRDQARLQSLAETVKGLAESLR